MANFKHLHLTIAGYVATVANLAELATQEPGPNAVGAVRWVEDIKALRFWDGTAWIEQKFTDLVVDNLTVNNISYLNSNTVEIGDNFIVLNNDVTGAPTENSGLIVERGTQPDAIFRWNETTDVWEAGVDGGPYFPLTTIVTPTFLLTRSGASGAETWLMNGQVPSNQSGIHISEPASSVISVFVDNSAVNTFSIGIYEHDHITYTQVGAVSVTADYGGEFSVDFPLTQGMKLAAKIESGACNDITVGIQLQA